MSIIQYDITDSYSVATINIHSSSNYFLSASSVHGTPVGAQDTSVNKEDKNPCLVDFTI